MPVSSHYLQEDPIDSSPSPVKQKPAKVAAQLGLPVEWAFAADWWSARLNTSALSNNAIAVAASASSPSPVRREFLQSGSGASISTLQRRFRNALLEEISQRFQGHWYADQPLKGSAFRSISVYARVDPLLRKAGEAIGIQNTVEKMLFGAKNCCMFINPGEVYVQQGREVIEVVYKASSSSEKNLSPVLELSENNSSNNTGDRLSGNGSSSCKETSLGRSSQLGAIMSI